MMRTLRNVICIAAIFSVLLVVPFMRERSILRADAPIIDGERYIVVVIPSYKNSQWVDINLSNVFAQKYSNYHVVYIDDVSPDNTYERVVEIVKKHGQQDRVMVIKNEQRMGALANLYNAIHACPDGAIIVTLDGDDWFPERSNDILQTINQAYSDPNVWLTYGQFKTYPEGHLGICHPMPEHVIKSASYRKQEWFVSHLRTFYAGFFKKIHKEDLMMNGEFYSVAWDQAILFPLLEMADGRIKFIDKIMYTYNQANPLNDFRQHGRKQLEYERIIRRKDRYASLDPEIAQRDFLVS